MPSQSYLLRWSTLWAAVALFVFMLASVLLLVITLPIDPDRRLSLGAVLINAVLFGFLILNRIIIDIGQLVQDNDRLLNILEMMARPREERDADLPPE